MVWPTPAQQLGFQASVRVVTEHTERRTRLAHALPTQGQTWRLAPDGSKAGGSHLTESSRSNRRVLRAPALPMDAVQQEEAQAKPLVASP